MVIQKDGRSAVFLPQVAPEQGWDLPTTLSHLCRKAGLPSDAWKASDARFTVFEAIVFGEDKKAKLGPSSGLPQPEHILHIVYPMACIERETGGAQGPAGEVVAVMGLWVSSTRSPRPMKLTVCSPTMSPPRTACMPISRTGLSPTMPLAAMGRVGGIFIPEASRRQFGRDGARVPAGSVF